MIDVKTQRESESEMGGSKGGRGRESWTISLNGWNVCPLPQIPSCGARDKKNNNNNEREQKLMSLGRTICLSGLL